MANVLLVEDDRKLANTIAQLLPSHHVRIAHDGEEALVEATRAAPDAVLLDLGLPLLDGFDVARRLRQIFGRAVRLIAYTGRSDVTQHQLRDAGFDELLTKPASIEQISDAIRNGQGD
jgi:DNA-binding response OmpR family regulator